MLESGTEQTGVVSGEFPLELLPLLRCSRDAGPLVIVEELRSGAVGIIEVRLRCGTCVAEYRIEEGSAPLIEGPLTPEGKHEISIIDAGHACIRPGPFVPSALGWRSELSGMRDGWKSLSTQECVAP